MTSFHGDLYFSAAHHHLYSRVQYQSLGISHQADSPTSPPCQHYSPLQNSLNQPACNLTSPPSIPIKTPKRSTGGPTNIDDVKKNQASYRSHKGQFNIHEVDEIDLSVYTFTGEETKRVVRKFDWHVN